MRLLVASIIIVGLGAATTAARADDGLEIVGTRVNVRTGPGPSYRALGHVHEGEVYALAGRQGEWYRFQHTNGEAWSHESLVRTTPSPILEVTAQHVNVRTGPASRYRDIGDLSMGARVAVRGTSGEWKKIYYGGRAAWVHGQFLGAVGSIASGGRPRSAAGFIQLPASGPGFYSYAVPGRRWGTPSMVYGLERIGRAWVHRNPSAPRIGVGDLSLENGGDITGHASHEKGVDVDVRLMPKGPDEIVVTRFWSTYSRVRTAALIRIFKDELPTTLTLFNDRSVPGTIRWPNHDNHFHVRIRK